MFLKILNEHKPLTTFRARKFYSHTQIPARYRPCKGDAMQAKLLQKIEELTLYVIEKEKEIITLKTEKDKQFAEQQRFLMELKKEILKNK